MKIASPHPPVSSETRPMEKQFVEDNRIAELMTLVEHNLKISEDRCCFDHIKADLAERLYLQECGRLLISNVR